MLTSSVFYIENHAEIIVIMLLVEVSDAELSFLKTSYNNMNRKKGTKTKLSKGPMCIANSGRIVASSGVEMGRVLTQYLEKYGKAF